MTSFNDDLKDRSNNLGKGRTLTDGSNATAFGDPTGQHPRVEYQNSSPVNIGARTSKMHKLSFGGSAGGIPASAMSSLGNQYPLNDVRETISGHVLEFNDTPGGERILIRHNSGSGVEMRPDGTIIVSALGNKVEVCGGDNTVIVEGDTKLMYKGNLNLEVTGDFNVTCLNYSITTKGDKKEDIAGSKKESVFGNYTFKVSGHLTQTVAQNVTQTFLGSNVLSVKSNYSRSVGGNNEVASKGISMNTSESEYAVSTPNLNMAAKSLSVFGATGTIGGESIVHYGLNYYGISATMSKGITAPTFHGTLNGRAKEAIASDTAVFASYGGGPGSAAGWTAEYTPTDTTATAKPTDGILTSYLKQGSKGIKEVTIDAGNFLTKALMAPKANPDDVRAKLRDPANLNNPEYTARAVGEGKLNPNYALQAPPNGFGRVRAAEPGCERGTVAAGNADKAGSNKTFRRQESFQRRSRTLIPDQQYNVNNMAEINVGTKLGPGISMAKFLGGKSPANINHLPLDIRKQLARNYYLHSQIIKYVMNRPGQQPTDFEDFRLEVAEGYYKPARYGMPEGQTMAPEVLTEGSALWKRSKGILVVYELINNDGKIDIDATFELATYFKDKCSHLFDKLSLDYDEFDPSGELNVQLIIEVPEVPEDYTINSKGECDTLYNNKVQGKDSLIEIKPTKKTTTTVVPEVVQTPDESKAQNRDEAYYKKRWQDAYNAWLDKDMANKSKERNDPIYIGSDEFYAAQKELPELRAKADALQKEWYDWREANGLPRAPSS